MPYDGVKNCERRLHKYEWCWNVYGEVEINDVSRMLRIQHRMTLFLASLWRTLFIASLINTFGPATTIKHEKNTSHGYKTHIRTARHDLYISQLASLTNLCV